MRVSDHLADKIRAGQAMGLNVLLPEATNRLGGFSDACHSLTAATTVAIGKEEELINEMERILIEKKLLSVEKRKIAHRDLCKLNVGHGFFFKAICLSDS